MDVKLVTSKANGQQKIIPLKGPVTVLGRAQDCDIRIPIESCSRKQCELRIEGDQLQFKDLGSSNGTLLNNYRVEEATLKAGDKLTIGAIILTVQIDGQPATAPSTQPAAGDQTEDKGKEPKSLAGDSSPGQSVSEDSGGNMDALTAAPNTGEMGDDDPLAALEALADLQDEDKDK